MVGFRLAVLALALTLVALLAFDVTGLYSHGLHPHLLRSYDRMGQAGWQTDLGTSTPGEFAAACRRDFACWSGYSKDLFTAWPPVQPLNLALAATALLLFTVFARTGPGPIEKDPGTAMWAKAYQLRENLRASKKRPLFGYFGIYWNRRMVQLPASKRFAHSVVVGAPGAMKTTGYHKQNAVQDAEDGWSIIIMDMKYPEAKEGLGNLLPIIERIGNHELRLFLPYEHFSHRFDLFELARDQEGASELAGILFEAVEGEPAYYLNAKRTLVTGLLQALAHRPQPALSDLVQILNQGLAGLKKLSGSDSTIPAEALENIMGTLQLPKEHGASVMKAAADRLFLFRNPALSANLSGARFPEEKIDVLRLTEVPTALYIGMPQDKVEDGSGALLLQLVKKILDKYIQKAAFKNGGRVKNPVSFYLDEFANLGIIPNIATNLATNRQRQISYHLSLQNLSQGKAIYGPVEFNALASGNLQSRMYFPAFIADDDRTEVSERLGQITVREKTKSRLKAAHPMDGRAGSAEKKASRPLLSPEDMRTWPHNVAVLELNGVHPVQVIIPRFDQQWTWVRHFYRKQNRFSRFIYLPYRNPFYRYQKMIPKDFDLRLWSSARIRSARQAALERPLPVDSEIVAGLATVVVTPEPPLRDSEVGHALEPYAPTTETSAPAEPPQTPRAANPTPPSDPPAPLPAAAAKPPPPSPQPIAAPKEPTVPPRKPTKPPQALLHAFQAFATTWMEQGKPVTLFGGEKKVTKVIFETGSGAGSPDPETLQAWLAAQLVKVPEVGMVAVAGKSLSYLPEPFQSACLHRIAARRNALRQAGKRVGPGPFRQSLVSAKPAPKPPTANPTPLSGEAAPLPAAAAKPPPSQPVAAEPVMQPQELAPQPPRVSSLESAVTADAKDTPDLAALAIMLNGTERSVLESWLSKNEQKGSVLPPDQPRLASSYRDYLALWVDPDKTLVMVRRTAVKKLIPRAADHDALTRGGYPMLVFALPPSDSARPTL